MLKYEDSFLFLLCGFGINALSMLTNKGEL